jgi:nucleotide-binding universal stress UspA family protein
MYKRILLAYDGSVEGRTALREGALLAKQCGAEVFLLSVIADSGTLLLSEVALAGASVHTWKKASRRYSMKALHD